MVDPALQGKDKAFKPFCPPIRAELSGAMLELACNGCSFYMADRDSGIILVPSAVHIES